MLGSARLAHLDSGFRSRARGGVLTGEHGSGRMVTSRRRDYLLSRIYTCWEAWT